MIVYIVSFNPLFPQIETISDSVLVCNRMNSLNMYHTILFNSDEQSELKNP